MARVFEMNPDGPTSIGILVAESHGPVSRVSSPDFENLDTVLPDSGPEQGGGQVEAGARRVRGQQRFLPAHSSVVLWMAIALLILLAAGNTSVAEEDPKPPEPRPAKVKISGYGLLGQFRLKQMLRILQEDKTRPELLDANYIEDAALLLMSRLSDEGYLRPVITAGLTLEDGQQVYFVWDEAVEEPLPRPMAVRAVHFEIEKGVFHHIEHVEFSGLESISSKRALSYFIETGGLFSLKRNRVFSPERLKRSVANLEDQLQRLGFQDAIVIATNLNADPITGAVGVRIVVNEGPRFIVRSVQEEVFIGKDPAPTGLRTNWPSQFYSKIWEQDYAQGIRTNFYRQGYPDTVVSIQTLKRTAGTNEVQLDLKAVTRTGQRIRVGDVSFSGNDRTRAEVLEKRLPLKEGDWLDRIRAERGRYRLSRLGVFDSVELNYQTVDEQTRNVLYELKEGKQIDVSLLFGYGSYELLRGGVQVDQYNVFGRAHHQRLKLVQSFKSSNADYIYTMPEFFGENMDVFLTASGLRREEISFTRLEYGGGAGVRKYLRNIKTDISTRYDYEILEAQGADADLEEVGLKDSRAAAIITDLNHDRRDNPLYPRQGYKLFANIELASEYLGGDVDYQRLDLTAAWHWSISDAQWIHWGVSHGLVATIGSRSEDLPFNRRFFPGGENSVRGFQQGEAAPRNADGDVIGAESYLLGNLEFEQGLTPSWSVVTFVDAVGFAQHLENYPIDETLVSVGGGVRWKTFIGPVRLEYGYNLNPRPKDPVGTLHFSLGFPF